MMRRRREKKAMRVCIQIIKYKQIVLLANHHDLCVVAIPTVNGKAQRAKEQSQPQFDPAKIQLLVDSYQGLVHDHKTLKETVRELKQQQQQQQSAIFSNQNRISYNRDIRQRDNSSGGGGGGAGNKNNNDNMANLSFVNLDTESSNDRCRTKNVDSSQPPIGGHVHPFNFESRRNADCSIFHANQTSGHANYANKDSDELAARDKQSASTRTMLGIQQLLPPTSSSSLANINTNRFSSNFHTAGQSVAKQTATATAAAAVAVATTTGDIASNNVDIYKTPIAPQRVPPAADTMTTTNNVDTRRSSSGVYGKDAAAPQPTVEISFRK